MRRKHALVGGIAAAAAVLLAAVPARAAPAVEIRFGFGGWTLAPFHSPVESRSEDIIRDQFEALLKSSLPDWIVGPVDADIDLSSSGGVLSAEAWIPVGKSRFAAGVRGDVFSFRIPFRAAAHETLRLGGLPVAELWGTSSGKVILKGFGVSLLGRWRAVASRRIDLAVRAGLSLFPFQGRAALTGALRVETILGGQTYTGGLDRSIAEIRRENGNVPRFVFAPVLGLEAGVRVFRRWRLYALVSISQGTFYSLGIEALL